jgi:hypothetical protein
LANRKAIAELLHELVAARNARKDLVNAIGTAAEPQNVGPGGERMPDPAVADFASRMHFIEMDASGVLELPPSRDRRASASESLGIAAIGCHRHGKTCICPNCLDRVVGGGFNSDLPTTIEAVRSTKISENEIVTRYLATVDLHGALIVDGKSWLTLAGLFGDPRLEEEGGRNGDPRQWELVAAVAEQGADGIWIRTKAGDVLLLFLVAFDRGRIKVRDLALYRISRDDYERDPPYRPATSPPKGGIGQSLHRRLDRRSVRWWSLRRQIAVVMAAAVLGLAVGLALPHIATIFGINSMFPSWLAVVITIAFVIAISPFVMRELRPYKKLVLLLFDLPGAVERVRQDVEYLRRTVAEELETDAPGLRDRSEDDSDEGDDGSAGVPSRL